MGKVGNFLGDIVGKVWGGAKDIIGKIKGVKDFVGKLPLIGSFIENNPRAAAISTAIDTAAKVADYGDPIASGLEKGLRNLPFSQRPRSMATSVNMMK